MLNSSFNLHQSPQNFFNNFEDFFMSSPDLLCVAGYDGYFKKINPSVSRLLEYSEEELFARPINDFVFEADKNSTATVREDLTRRIGLFNFENRYVTKSGKILWILWTSHPVENNEVIYAVGKNITAKKEVELERKAQLKLLTQLNQELRRLTYTTAHDLRSPVNNLLSVFDLLDTSTISDVETLELISILEITTKSIKKTLNDTITVLDNKYESDNHIESLNLELILGEVLASINSLVQNSKAIIKFDFSNLPNLSLNRTALKSIFLNLITNSIKYSKRNTVPEIFISSTKNNELIITDNGIGFDMNIVKDKLFGLHQTFSSHEDSTGIGLYLVHNHVINSGGTISLESDLNKGAKFIISFKK